MKQITKLFLTVVVFVLSSCGSSQKNLQELKLNLVPAFVNLKFDQPVSLVSPPDDTNRICVIEQKGFLQIFKNSSAVTEKKIFLDIHLQVKTGHTEEGLLGLAFHPDYRHNGYFYLDYVADNPRRTVISRFTVSPDDPNRADPKSELVLLQVEQPYGNHKGGQLAFGPDGYLYIAFGDGGSGGDPHGNGQNRKALLGKILRIDVDSPDPGKNYGIPKDNPFVGNTEGFREEIFAYGLRNPWRFSFDPVTGWLWAADVGQDKPWEEIDLIQKGKNYGWNIMEGNHCYHPPQLCDQRGLQLPIWEYTNDQGRCIIGGFVYRGKKIPGLVGNYVYGDFVSGRISRLIYDGKNATVNREIIHEPNLYPSSFGVDKDQELYICSFDGSIYRLSQ